MSNNEEMERIKAHVAAIQKYQALQAKVAELEERRGVLLAGIPQTWGELPAKVREWFSDLDDGPNHWYGNRTTEENAVWICTRLLEKAADLEAQVESANDRRTLGCEKCGDPFSVGVCIDCLKDAEKSSATRKDGE